MTFEVGKVYQFTTHFKPDENNINADILSRIHVVSTIAQIWSSNIPDTQESPDLSEIHKPPYLRENQKHTVEIVSADTTYQEYF